MTLIIPRDQQPVPWTYDFPSNDIQRSTIVGGVRMRQLPTGLTPVASLLIDASDNVFKGPASPGSGLAFIIPFNVFSSNTGIKASIPNINFSFEILGWTIENPDTGDLELDVLVDPYVDNSFPSTSIVAAAPPQMTGVKSAHSSALTGWTTTILANSSVALSVTSIATLTQFAFSLQCQRL